MQDLEECHCDADVTDKTIIISMNSFKFPPSWLFSQGTDVPSILICLASTAYNQKSHFLLVCFGTATTYSPLNKKISLNYFNVS